jgi:hypothetical protein
MRLQTYQNLVEEILDELLFERARGEQAVQIGPKEFGDEIATWKKKNLAIGPRWFATGYVHVLQRRDEDIAQTDDLDGCQYILIRTRTTGGGPHVLVPDMLEQLQLSVSSFR